MGVKVLGNWEGQTADLQRHPSTLQSERFRQRLRYLSHLASGEIEAYINNDL